jgi:hypothetical protein
VCAVSMVMDSKADDWSRRYWQAPPAPVPLPTPQEVEEFRRLLDRAREYDRRTGQERCELEEKRRRLRDMAEDLGVKIDFV